MMLHTKYQGSLPYGFRQEDFSMFLAPFSMSRFKVPVHPGLMIRDEPCHNRGGTVDNLGDPG